MEECSVDIICCLVDRDCCLLSRNVQVYSYVLQGRLENARQMLSLHSQASSTLYRTMDRMLAMMPMYSVSVIYFTFYSVLC